uniref:PNPLA domain-containing protein n=1 Tax=Pseudo-nitzschia australis TaxID=44445 RepID=A0A7S4EEV3_9STRA
MNDTGSLHRNYRRFWRMQFQKLRFVIISLTVLTPWTGYVLSFQRTSNCRRTVFRNLKETFEDFDRHSLLHATISEDLYVEDTPSQNTRIVFPGGGIFFYYQAGLVSFLRERYDLSTCTFSGASAGALTATLTAADVDFYEATDLALKMAEDAGVWDRSGGLQGIWGPMIEEWLDSLLPTCIEALQDRITLLVTPVPSFGKTKVSNFKDRKDLIRCNMASVHLVSNTAVIMRGMKKGSSLSLAVLTNIVFKFSQPWFLDGKLTSNFRDRPHVDGSFLSKEDDYIPEYEEASTMLTETIFLDWSKDPAMSSKGGINMVEALSPDGIYGLIEQGKLYGKIMEEQGKFESLRKLT